MIFIMILFNDFDSMLLYKLQKVAKNSELFQLVTNNKSVSLFEIKKTSCTKRVLKIGRQKTVDTTNACHGKGRSSG